MMEFIRYEKNFIKIVSQTVERFKKIVIIEKDCND